MNTNESYCKSPRPLVWENKHLFRHEVKEDHEERKRVKIQAIIRIYCSWDPDRLIVIREQDSSRSGVVLHPPHRQETHKSDAAAAYLESLC